MNKGVGAVAKAHIIIMSSSYTNNKAIINQLCYLCRFFSPVVLPGCPYPPRGRVLVAGVDHPPQEKKTLSEGAQEGVVGEDAEGGEGVVSNSLSGEKKSKEN